MLDTAPITAEIAKLIAAGVTEGELVARVLRQFPEITLAELSQALQVAADKAERAAARRH
jgi:uncharacterized protein (DUF433 family)